MEAEKTGMSDDYSFAVRLYRAQDIWVHFSVCRMTYTPNLTEKQY